MTSINDLPDEVLAKILECCPKTHYSYIRLENVCTKWRNVVEKTQGIFMVAGTQDGFDISFQEVKSNSRLLLDRNLRNHTFDIENIFEGPIIFPATSKEISEINGSPISNTDEDAKNANNNNSPSSSSLCHHFPFQELETKLLSSCTGPDFVKKLSFIGNLPIQVPTTYILMTKNLSGLHFHLTSLVGIIDLNNLSMDIPTLQTLVIDSFGLRNIWKNCVPETREKMTHVLTAVIHLLEQNLFPHLQTLIIDLPLCFEKERSIVTAIASFLGRHHAVIQSFCYHQSFPVVITDLDALDSSDEEEVDPNEVVSLGSLASSSAELKKVSLKELHIGLYSPQESDPLWINFMIQQDQLKKMIFTGDQIPFPGITVRVNQSSLTTLIMEIRDNVDCIYLKDCCHLEKLYLFGKCGDDQQNQKGDKNNKSQNEQENEEEEDEDDDDSEMEIDDPNVLNRNINIFNLELLPCGLKNLRINRLKIHRKPISEIICSQRWTQLEQLELIECGVEGNLGVPLKAILHILENKRFQWFQIDCSLNRKSVHERLPSKPLEMLGYMLRNNSISTFTIQGYLNVMGIYEILRRKPTPTDNNEQDQELVFYGTEPDLFQFPEEIFPTGCHRLPDVNDFKKSKHDENMDSTTSATSTSDNEDDDEEEDEENDDEEDNESSCYEDISEESN